MKKISLILCAVALLFFASCVNEDERLGLSLIQNDDAINVLIDNSTGVTLEAKMFQTDTVLTSKLRYNALGSYKDNNFGKITSCIYSQVSLSTSLLWGLLTLSFYHYCILVLLLKIKLFVL